MESGYSTLERRLDILEKISKHSLVKVNDLVDKYKVTSVTIRKDLTYLEKKNQLIKVRGGAIANKELKEVYIPTVTEKTTVRQAEKKRIGIAAAALIKENDTIIIDSGSTTLEIVRNFQSLKNLTVITNALNIATELCVYNRFNIIMPGGNMLQSTHSLVGFMAEASLKQFYCDKLFMGVDSFSIYRGLSTPVAEEARINQIMISIAKEVIAVCDSSKFNKRGFAFIASVAKVNTIITDEGIPEDIHKTLLEMGKRVIIA